MSVQLVPEPIAAVAPPVFERPVNQRPDTRPVEPAGNASANSSEGRKTNGERSETNKAEPSPRPPGTDPSLPPQTFFDASLISSSFKPSTKPADVQALSQADTPDTTTRGDTSAPASTRATDDRSEPSTADKASPDTDSRTDTRQLAAYSRGSGGSQLSVPAAANPDWLTAVSKIA